MVEDFLLFLYITLFILKTGASLAAKTQDTVSKSFKFSSPKCTCWIWTLVPVHYEGYIIVLRLMEVCKFSNIVLFSLIFLSCVFHIYLCVLVCCFVGFCSFQQVFVCKGITSLLIIFINLSFPAVGIFIDLIYRCHFLTRSLR